MSQDIIKKVAPGYLVSLLNGRQIYVSVEQWDEDAQWYKFSVECVTEIKIIQEGHKMQCQARSLSKSLFGILEIRFPVGAIAMVERVTRDSFVYRAVIEATTGLKIAGGQFT